MLDLAYDLRTIRGDAGALSHAIMNLCLNALDAMPEEGILTVRTRLFYARREFEKLAAEDPALSEFFKEEGKP